jgi:hypothetical protein
MAISGPKQAFGITLNDCYYRILSVAMLTKTSWMAHVVVFAIDPRLNEGVQSIDVFNFEFSYDMNSELNPIAQAYEWLKSPVGGNLCQPNYIDC